VKYAEVVKAVNEVLSAYDVKMTLRQIYYRLVSKYGYPNTKAAYKGLSRQLVKAREAGEVDDSRIEDRSRKAQGHGDYGWDSTEEFIQHYIAEFKECPQYFTKEVWKDQPVHVILALEKDALSRIFVDVAGGYRVKVYATKGYGSYTFLKDLAAELDSEKHNIILYFGDYDPSGRDIERDLKDRIERYSYGEEFTVKRIALTKAQISEYDLPPMPEDAETLAKLRRDSRTATYGMQFAVELDAIEPDELQRLIRDAIVAQIDKELWDSAVAAIEEEKGKLEEQMEGVKVVFPNGDEF
jgi:hypothetical protein